MNQLIHSLGNQFAAVRAEISSLIRDHGEFPISSVQLSQLFGGMRNIRALVCDTSVVDAKLGLSIRGRRIVDLQDCCPEEVFWLLLTGKLPQDNELQSLRSELASRRELPPYLNAVLAAMPADSHPMTMFNAAIIAMQRESVFAASQGELPRDELWKAALEDALNLFARLPMLAARVRRLRYGLPESETTPVEDWTRNLARMLTGRVDDALEALLRRYMVVQSDHESGNVCALACHVTGSTHADPYYAISAGLNGLAGHIHGLAAQDFIRFLLDLRGTLPADASHADLCGLLRSRLDSGRILPGFGHAVLRQQDPRFGILNDYAGEHFSDAGLYQLATRVYRAGTEVLSQHPRVKNPHPNVDAITGVVLYESGIEELEFYTVLFGTALSIGMLAQFVISRGIGSPIVRPRSLSLAEVHSLIAAS